MFSSGRILLPTKKKTVVICFKVDWEGVKNYKRVLDKLSVTIARIGLQDQIRIKVIAHDLITCEADAHKYRDAKDVNLIIWGNTDYGNRNNEKLLIFEVHHTIYISPKLKNKLNLFLSDLALILLKKDWAIKEINELDEYKIVANNFLETILFILGIYFYDDIQIESAIKFFEYLLPILEEKESKNNIIEYQIQSGRVRSLLIELYFLQARTLHDEEKNHETLHYLKKIPEYIPHPLPVYMLLARTYYLCGDEKNAQVYTEKMRQIDKRHPAVCLNYAFFGIKQKNYDRTKFWYDEFIKLKDIKDVDIATVITFLDEEYQKSPTEHAYLYGLGIVNKFFDNTYYKKDLQKFIKLTKNRPEYIILNKRAKELVKKGT